MFFYRVVELAANAVETGELSIKEAQEAGLGLGWNCRELVVDNLGRVWLHYVPRDGDYRVTAARYGTCPVSCAFERALVFSTPIGKSAVIKLV